MNKRTFYKFKMTKFYEVDLLGIFFRKQKLREYKLKKLGFIYFFEQIQVPVFKFVLFRKSFISIRTLTVFFAYLNYIERQKKRKINFKIFKKFNYLLNGIFFKLKRINYILINKLLFYRNFIYYKYNTNKYSTDTLILKPLLSKRVRQKLVLPLEAIDASGNNIKPVLTFGCFYFNSSISKSEYMLSLLSFKTLVAFFKKKKKGYLIKKLYSLEPYQIKKRFTLELMEVSKVKYKKRRFLSLYHHHILKIWKVCKFYGGLSRRQLKAICSGMLKKRGNVFIQFIIALESRIDSLLFRSSFVTSIYEARQLINHKKICVNGSCITKRSYVLKNNDILSFNFEIKQLVVKKVIQKWNLHLVNYTPPTYLEVNYKLCMVLFLSDLIKINDVPFGFKFSGKDLHDILYYYY